MLDRLGYGHYPSCLRRFLLTVTCVGSVVPFTILALGAISGVSGWRGWLLAALLTGLATVAEYYPLHLTHKTNLNVATAAYVAALLLLPWWQPAALALTAVMVAQAVQWKVYHRIDPSEALFNVGQTALYVLAGCLVFGLFAAVPLGPEVGPFGSLGALALAATAMHLLNTGLVAGAAGLQMGINPVRVWWSNLALDLTPHVTLTVLGTGAALIAHAQPLGLLALALPGVLVHRAVRQTVRLRVDTHEALASLVEVVELRDPYTAGHSRRVAATARLLALRLGLTAEEADLIESAGRVHDIGKVALDPAILTKPTNLNEAEWAQLRLHPVHGANVVERFAVYQRGTAMVRHHHERWDGSGYPDGMAGEAIPLGARILAVADAFDALTSDRPYRAGLSVALATAILRDGADSQWDARVVAAMLAQLREAPEHVPLCRSGVASATAAEPAGWPVGDLAA